jgi:uncharacterized membrane protein
MTTVVSIPEKSRISSIDIARGIIIVIMTLDHVRDYFHADALVFDPTNMEKTNTALFFTRWITHFCAPSFVLLSGMSMYISLQRKTKKELSEFLWTRGLWLIVLEWTILRFAMFFNFYYDMTILTVLWVIGWCMIFMAGLLYLKELWLLIFALILIFVINPMNLAIPGLTGTGFFPVSPSFAFIISYPLVPWLGLMVVGFTLGRFYMPDIESEKRKKMLFNVGLALIAFFLVLRWINGYGDMAPWKSQSTAWFTFLSFLNVTKHPLSMLCTLMTLGPIFILLSLLEGSDSSLLKPFNVFGRVPLFYFILHFFLAHAGALILFMIKTGKSFSEIDFHFNKSFGGITAEGGFSLTGVYIAWIVVVIIMYPLSQWYDRYKTTHRQWWLSYL